MKIISKFHDYYDAALRYGGNDLAHYVRDNVVHHGYDDKLVAPLMYNRVNASWEVNIRTKLATFSIERYDVLFCGLMYTTLKVIHDSNAMAYSEKEETWFYDYDSMVEYFAKFDHEFKPSRYGNRLLYKEMLSDQGRKTHYDWAIENRIPIATFEYRSRNGDFVTLNGPLKQMQFYRVFDAYQAYQELDMFIGGTLAQQDMSASVVSDKDRIAQRGFDKWSFRKMPEKK